MTNKRIASLDGLRGACLIVVLVGHLSGTQRFPILRSGLMVVYAQLALRIFFVMSGFLITTLLLNEHARKNRIDIWQFYVRRAYKIWPAAVAFTTVAMIVFWSKLTRFDIVAAYLYLSNFRAARPWQLAHLWSLAVEEQFYMLWPWLLAFWFARRREFAIGAILLAPICRFVLWYTVGPDASGNYFPAVMDALATGCLLAMVFDQLPTWIESRWCLLLWPVLLVLPVYHAGSRLQSFVGLTLVYIIIALLIANCVKAEYALFNFRPLMWLGVVSYSFYLCQQPFLNRASSAWFCRFPENILLATIAALVCHYGVERPFLSMRERKRAATKMLRVAAPAEV